MDYVNFSLWNFHGSLLGRNDYWEIVAEFPGNDIVLFRDIQGYSVIEFTEGREA